MLSIPIIQALQKWYLVANLEPYPWANYHDDFGRNPESSTTVVIGVGRYSLLRHISNDQNHPT